MFLYYNALYTNGTDTIAHGHEEGVRIIDRIIIMMFSSDLTCKRGCGLYTVKDGIYLVQYPMYIEIQVL